MPRACDVALVYLQGSRYRVRVAASQTHVLASAAKARPVRLRARTFAKDGDKRVCIGCLPSAAGRGGNINRAWQAALIDKRNWLPLRTYSALGHTCGGPQECTA